MKKITSILLTLTMLATVGCSAMMVVSAETTTNLGSYEVFSSDGKATFMDYTEDKADVIIPSVVEGNPVAEVAPNVFLNKNNTENIFIDENSEYFTSVDGVLFTKDMTTLVAYPKNNPRAEYTVPDGVESIAENAFVGSGNLKSVILPEGVTKIKKSCFRDCTSLESIKVPHSVETIEGGCFNNCTSLKSFDFPASLKSMSFPSFSNCTSLTDISLEPHHAKVFLARILEPTAFFKEESNWENGALYKEGVLISVKQDTDGEFEVKDGTKAIAMFAFDNSKVTKVTVADGVEYIGPANFVFCSELTEVYIPESVTEISEKAFKKNQANLVISGFEGSYAESYAEMLGIEFKAVRASDDSLGDVNGDGKLNVRDATAIQKHLARVTELDESELSVADFNEDGRVNVKDATAIQKFIAGFLI